MPTWDTKYRTNANCHMPVTRMNISEETRLAAMVVMISKRFRIPVISAYAPTIGARTADTNKANDIIRANTLEAVSLATAFAASSLTEAPIVMKDVVAMAMK